MGRLEWGQRGWNWVQRVSSQGVGVGEVKGVGGYGSEEFGSRGRVEIKVGGVGVAELMSGVGFEVREVGVGYGRLGSGGWRSWG